MHESVRIVHVVHIDSGLADAEALAARLRGVMTADTFRVPTADSLAGLAVGRHVRVVLHLADGREGWSIEGRVAARVEGRSISIWREGAVVGGPIASTLQELTRDWDVATVPSPVRANVGPDRASNADAPWEEETEVRDQTADVCFADTTLEISLSGALSLAEEAS